MTSPAWHPWATAQIVVAWLGLLAAVGLAILGGAAIVSDSADHTDTWDGLGVALGIAACLVALFLATLSEVVRRLTRRGVDRAKSGDPSALRTAAHVALAAVAVTALGALNLVGSLGSAPFLLLIPTALMAAPGIGILLTARRPSEA